MNYFFQFKGNRLSPYTLMRLRERYMFTRNNRLRLRYSASAVSCVLVSLIVFGLQPKNSVALYNSTSDYDSTFSQILQDVEPASGVADQAYLSDSVKARISDSMRSAPVIIKKAEKLPFRKVSVGAGETIAGVLQGVGVDGTDSYYAVKEISEYFDPRKVKAGQKLGVYFKEAPDGEMKFDKLSMKISPVKEISVIKKGDKDFTASLVEQELERKVYGRFADIETSLYGSAARADIPSSVIAEMIRIYSWNVDFQRDIRRGDKVQVLYEAFENEDGDFAKYGDVLYASLNIGGKEKPIYRFKMDDGRVDYFEPDGTSIRKTLMKTPIDGARISSGFGMRRHPVLGYGKMHKGMDFAASTGTPIYAAGDGVIEYASRFSSYGNYVRIRHNSKLKTAYAHMSKFKSGITPGKSVKQGDVIGYVGTTGRSTGPHLHYEVLLNGTQVDPKSVKLPTGEILVGQQLNRFKSFVRGVDQQYASLTRGLKFASYEASSHGDDNNTN